MRALTVSREFSQPNVLLPDSLLTKACFHGCSVLESMPTRQGPQRSIPPAFYCVANGERKVMKRLIASPLFSAAALSLAAMVGAAGHSFAAEPTTVFEWGAGEACPNFALRVELFEPGRLMEKTFIDKNGNPVRFLQAGQNFPIKFINLNSGSSYSVKPEGTVWNIAFNPDGSQTWTMTGHTIITWGNTEPGGPATIRYIGRLVAKLDSSGSVVSVPDFKGKKIDICAALS